MRKLTEGRSSAGMDADELGSPRGTTAQVYYAVSSADDGSSLVTQDGDSL